MNQPPPQQQQPIVQQVHHHHHSGGPEPGIAVVLEILPGLMMQTFGIGNMYAGNVAAGLFMMIGHWVLTVVNFLLCLVVVGFITWPLTWVAFMIFCPILANDAAKKRRYGV